MRNLVVESALENIKGVAQQVRRCPSCNSEHIYTAINVAYVFDHWHSRLDAVSTIDLTENSWHGCFACDHQWVSGRMLEAVLPPVVNPPSARDDNVIDFAAARRKRSLV